MDFKRDVKLMTQCLKEAGIEDVKAYHGGMKLKNKHKIDSVFRNKEFQVLVTTESYDVGTHSPHVHSVIRIGCMPNQKVLAREFGRVGTSSEQSDGYLWFNEHKDDQRLSF